MNSQLYSFSKISVYFTAAFLAAITFSSSAQAAGGGGASAIGFALSFSTPPQNDMNTMIKNANTANGGISTSQLGTAYEFAPYYQYRFSGSDFALMIRPSYFTQTTTGSGTAGSFNYGITGWTLFPMLRMYALENNFMHFFLQAGMGYASLTGTVTEGTFSSTFSGDAFGAIAGLGAEFCFTPNHCMVIEGNGRYLPVPRSLVTSTSGTPGSTSMSQSTSGMEAEFQGEDLYLTLSGIQGILAYTYKF